MSEISDAKLKKELCIKTYNITIKCNTYSDREAVLDIIDNGRLEYGGKTLHEKEVIKYGDNSTVFFNEDYTLCRQKSLHKVGFLNNFYDIYRFRLV